MELPRTWSTFREREHQPACGFPANLKCFAANRLRAGRRRPGKPPPPPRPSAHPHLLHLPDYTGGARLHTCTGLTSTPGKDNGKRANLEFGPKAGEGGSFIVARTGTLNESRRASQAVIDHICFTMSNWKEADVRAALAAKNLKISGGRDGSLHVLDPFNYDVQFANLAEEDPFRHGTGN